MNDLTNIDIPRLKELFVGVDYVSVEDDFCIFDVKADEGRADYGAPFRFDGLMLVWCIKGGLRLSVNLTDYDVLEDTLFLCMPGNIFKVSRMPSVEGDVHYVCMAMSKEFAAAGKIDFGKGFSKALSLMDDPRMTLTREDGDVLGEHLKLIVNVAYAKLQCRKESICAIWGSMLHVMSEILDRKMEVPDDPTGMAGRNRQLLEQFLALVSEYHDRYRNVGFYADKLCLTPKYLSKLIKKVSGRSAPDWIDSFVILEAKNMLKYSDCTIKEIVYRLNFPNQSVFYKFFKARTGMTPSEYRKS